MHLKRRLYILARSEDIFHPRFFDVILASCPAHYTVIGAAMVKSRESTIDSIRYVVRLGGLRSLARLLVRIARRRVGAGYRSSVREVFLHHGLPIDDIGNPNDAAFLDDLERRQPDIVFCAVPNILKERILALPSLACVNRHAGKLPLYRGVEPVFHALRNGEQEVTVTYHTMAREIDAGGVLWEHTERVRDADTVYSLYERLFDVSARGFWEAVSRLEGGSAQPVDIGAGAYYRAPTEEQIREFRMAGRNYV